MTYNAAASQFALAGNVGLSISGIASLSVTFGSTVDGTVNPGLLIASGSLQSLDMTIDSAHSPIAERDVFNTTGLEFTHAARPPAVHSRWHRGPQH